MDLSKVFYIHWVDPTRALIVGVEYRRCSECEQIKYFRSCFRVLSLDIIYVYYNMCVCITSCSQINIFVVLRCGCVNQQLIYN